MRLALRLVMVAFEGVGRDRKAGSAPCPALSMIAAEVVVQDVGHQPLAVRRMTGPATQQLSLRSSVEQRHQMGDQKSVNSIEDRVDLTAIRGEATAGVAPLWITVEAVQLSQRTGAPGGPAGSNGQAPPPATNHRRAYQVGADQQRVVRTTRHRCDDQCTTDDSLDRRNRANGERRRGYRRCLDDRTSAPRR